MKELYEIYSSKNSAFNVNDTPLDIISIQAEIRKSEASKKCNPAAERFRKLRLAFQRSMQSKGPKSEVKRKSTNGKGGSKNSKKNKSDESKSSPTVGEENFDEEDDDNDEFE